MSSSILDSRRFVVAAVTVALTLLLVVLGSIEMFLRKQTDQTNEQAAYRRLFLQGVASWAAFGDSHVANGLVSTTWLDNLGQASDNLSTITEKARARAARGGLVGVILQADSQIFAFYRLNSDQGGRIVELHSENNSSSLQVLHSRNRPYLTALARSLFGALADMPVTPARPDPESGAWQREAMLRMQLHTPVPGFRSHPAAVLYRNLVAELRAKGLFVCLVRFPVSRAYRDVTDEAAAFGDAWDFFRETAAAEGATLADLRDTIPDSAFGDPDHLLPDAAPAVTETLRHLCRVEVG